MEIITSKNNSLIKQTVKLQQKKYRTETRLCLVEGIKILREAISCGHSVKNIFVTLSGYEKLQNENFELKNVTVVSDEIMDYITTTVTPQNLVAVVEIKQQKFSLPQTNFLVLDCLQDPSNMGAIIRTAAATGFTTIYTINCVDELNEKVVRASMGNLFKCKIISVNYSDLTNFKEMLYVADMKGSNIFNEKKIKGVVGLCIGNEGHGVSQELKKYVTNYFSIPMANNVESLNASVVAGIIMYHIIVNQKEEQ